MRRPPHPQPHVWLALRRDRSHKAGAAADNGCHKESEWWLRVKPQHTDVVAGLRSQTCWLGVVGVVWLGRAAYRVSIASCQPWGWGVNYDRMM